MSTTERILNGPYLIAPGATEITIVWETAQELPMKVQYGIQPEMDKCLAASWTREPPCREYETGCYLYTATINGLQPGISYRYAVCENGRILAEDSFTTLSERPGQIRMVTLSDSHLFHTEKQFSRMIERVRPEMILHGGDISFGTGYQREQYSTNWFQKIPDVLRQVPVYYIPGNHDDGPFFESFFTKPQAGHVHAMKDGSAFSFDYGPAHIVMADSNPWGLFEMNAVNSGLEADDETKEKIRSILKWIETDLQSEAACQASWRILIVHHPYTDLFNNKYIVPVAERCHADLVIGGHLHYYIKAASIDPELGAKVMYICQGSTQEPEASKDTGSGDQRLLGDFPEVVALGRNNYGLLEVTEEELNYKLYGFSAAGEDQLVDTIHMTHEEPSIAWQDVELHRLDNNGRVEIRGQVRNTGKAPVLVYVDLEDNQVKHRLNLFGSRENSHVVFLESGEEAHIRTVYQAGSQGQHDIRVADQRLQIVVFEPEQLSFAHMKVYTGKEKDSDCLVAIIEATNNLDRELLVPIPLYIDQHIVEIQNLFFGSHEKKCVEFRYRFQRGGSYQVSIADQVPKQIQIEEGIRIIPRIRDMSGRGHDGLLQGTPKVISNGKTIEVCFESYGDYIEIPSSPDFHVDTGFTSMVWAHVDRLARDNEMSHNPLMVRGRSVGWGATYLLRMVIERAGGLKWGTCHDITEYSWQGGRARIGDWMHYSMAFDKERGGDSWCDGVNVAHVAGIDGQCRIRQWETEPIFVGYSYIGHVIPEIQRPKYFTHLPGRVSQVRFYKTGLTDDENQRVFQTPEERGPQGEQLAVWYDFHTIMTTGTHTTEWRHPAVFAPDFVTEKKYWSFKQLKIDAVLPVQAGLKATVEVSDDGATVKESLPVDMQNGITYVDLSVLPKAQYIRIITEFSAEVGEEGTFVPEVKEYQIMARNETDTTHIFWSTRREWLRGTFTGAVGFAPVDRLREYPEYTDIIHG